MKEDLNTIELLKSIDELASFIDEYDQADAKSEIAEFSEHDPLKNLKLGLAENLSSRTKEEFSVSQEEAEEIVSQVEQELIRPNARKQVCTALKILSNDGTNLSIGIVSGVVAGLIAGGTITLPVISALPGIGIAVACFWIVRVGIEVFCLEEKNNDN